MAKVRMLKCVLLLTSLLVVSSQSTASAEVDQYTYDLVKDLTYKAWNRQDGTIIQFLGVPWVKIVGGEFTVDTNKVEVFPTQFEDKVISLVNCRDEEETYKQTKTIETEVFTSVEINETVSTSSDFKTGFKVGTNLASLDTEVLEKTQWQLSSKKTQTERKKITDKIDIDRKIKPRTALTIKARIWKGFARAPLVGNVILDAGVRLRWKLLAIEFSPDIPFILSDSAFFNAEPKYRTTSLRGFVYAQTYDRTDQIFSDKPVDPLDPICKDTYPGKTKEGSVIVVDGLIRDSQKPLSVFAAKDAGKQVKETGTITIKNEDLEDLFVWVNDLNAYGKPYVINGIRLNQGRTRSVDVQLDGSGEGRISWRVQRHNDEHRQRLEEEVIVKPETIVEVTTRFGR